MFFCFGGEYDKTETTMQAVRWEGDTPDGAAIPLWPVVRWQAESMQLLGVQQWGRILPAALKGPHAGEGDSVQRSL